LTSYEGADAYPAKSPDAPDGSVSWQHPHRDVRICMRRAVLRTLLSQAVNSSREEEPSEIGGVLWGKAFGDDSLVISEATFVSGSGRLFNDGSLDRRNIETTIHRPPPEPSLAVLGYFRSQTREDVCLTSRDRSLIEEHFEDPDSIFLVIRPVDMGLCMAEFFFWLDGRLQMDSSDLQVPFMVPEDNPGNDGLGRALVSHDGSDAPEPPEIRNSPSRQELTRDPAKRSAFLLPVLTILVLALIGATGAYFGSPVVRSRLQTFLQHAPDTGFDLQVARTGNGEISLNWNQFDPNIIRAQGATLNIIDGSRLSKLNLGYAQLRSGKVTYSPQSDDVEFRLEVDSENGDRITKSVHALAPPTETLAEGVSPNREASGSPVRVGKFTRDKPGKSAPRAAQGNDDILVEVPLDVGANPNDPPKVVLEVTTVVPPAPKPAAPDVYTPPFVLEEMMPETTRFGQFEQVSVKVEIDPSGHVTAAWATVNGNESQSPAAAVAVSAAKRWIFHPAALNGKAVPSEYTIVFSFHPHPV
jgi:hypothetical protein